MVELRAAAIMKLCLLRVPNESVILLKQTMDHFAETLREHEFPRHRLDIDTVAADMLTASTSAEVDKVSAQREDNHQNLKVIVHV